VSRDLADDQLTEVVRASFADAPSDRFRVVIDALVRHLHELITETELSEEEWLAGIRFLTEAGQISDDRRQELVLLSDVLGASMLVIGLNHRASHGATQSTVFGPFFVENAPRFENGADLANGAPGEACIVQGNVRSIGGKPVAGARVDVWQSDAAGMYDVQYDDLAEPRARGHLLSDDDGRFWFKTVRPTAYPIPTDGPVGRLLEATRRSPMRPAHVHFRIQARGYRTLTTHVFDAADPFLDSDAVFGVKDSLVATFESTEADGCRLAYEFVLDEEPRD
jgi:hydroxyquinol 1,2-dioxygenase